MFAGTGKISRQAAGGGAVRIFSIGAFLLLGLCWSSEAAAEAASKTSPIGVWQTIDDSTNQPKSHVQIWERNGKLYGKIVKLINPDVPDPVCTECDGSRKNAKITGMTILWGLTKGDDGWWEGGRVLDPENGKTYRAKLQVTNGGSKLKLRGFVGVALFGRTQTWTRVR